MFNDRVRYILRGENFEEFKITDIGDDPIGWDQDTRKIERSKKSNSFITKYSENLEFVKESATRLYRHARQFGTKSNVTLTRQERNPKTDLFEDIYTESLDMKEYTYKDNKFSTKFLSGGFDELIKNQMSEKYELDREDDINGNPISKLTYKTVIYDGRKLFLQSLLENRDEILFQLASTGSADNFPLTSNITYESDDSVQSSNISGETFIGSRNKAFPEQSFFYVNKERERELRISISFKFNVLNTLNNRNPTLRLVIARGTYTNPGALMPIFDVQTLGSYVASAGTVFSDSFNLNYLIEKNQGVIIYLVLDSAFRQVNLKYEKKDLSIRIEEDSDFPATEANALIFHDALERQIEIITGSKKNFRSDYFKKGQFNDLLISSGKMIRKLPKLNDDQEPTDELESMTLSLKDGLSSSGYFNLGYGVETIGSRKIFIVEDLKYFFQNKITIRLGKVSDIERSFAEDYSWKSAEFGNDKAGDYEEQQGRFETNALNGYGFYSSEAENEFDGKSKLRSDLIAVEYARRKNNDIAPSEDTPYDKENFLLHSKLVNKNNFRLRKWRDDLEEQPLNVYDPESAGNFLLTPFASLERHGWLFRTSLNRFPDEYVRYTNTTGYSKMTTKLPGKLRRSENGNIKNKELGFPKFDDEIIKFNVETTFELRKQLYGSFEKDGRQLPNVYGLVEFINDANQKEYGWIISAEESDLASFEIIKASISNA
ncbi:hypothetical protein [Aquimarina sp. AU119]|uniref:hypothetical protein n=1 Tax=Aquimarina sp. AU119 TaxID=2108528 RepID=UPI000D6925AD|nr:hypothetical protein [Aquimarina sp. AU119]